MIDQQETNILHVQMLRQVFMKLNLAKKAKELTAFCTNTGKYQFKRMAMEICNGLSKYQESMNTNMII